MRTSQVRAGIYVRISDDRDGRGLGVARQEHDCRALAATRGWGVVEVFTDNDVSATSRRKRPEYERLLAAIEDGSIKAVVVWDVDRMTRKPAELEHFIDLAERHGIQLASVGGEIDLATPQGRLTARIKGSVARHEAEQIQRRIVRKVEELAADGKIANGGPRPFGYRRIFEGEGPRRKIIRDEIEPTEAEVIRTSVARVLAGDSLRSIVRDLNERRVATSTGRLWSLQALKLMLRSGRIAGLREHRDQVIGKAVWPAIISEDEHRLIRARLDGNVRPPGARVRTHYLTGFVYCDSCGAAGRMGIKPAHGKLKYVCPPVAEGGCNGRVVGKDDLEELVGQYLVARMSDPRITAQLAEREAQADDTTAELLARIEADERRLAVLQAAMADGAEDDLADVLAAAATVRARIKAARAELATATAVPALREDMPDLAARWDSLPLERKQALLRLFIDRITIAPARRGLGRFDAGRVTIIPRT